MAENIVYEFEEAEFEEFEEETYVCRATLEREGNLLPKRKTVFREALRKQKIDSHRPCFAGKDGVLRKHPWYNNLHQFSKNKIHCSCSMCRPGKYNRTMRFSDEKTKYFMGIDFSDFTKGLISIED